MGRRGTPEYIQTIVADSLHVDELSKATQPAPTQWKTLYITGGRRDKISKGDVAGLFIKQGKVKNEQVGVIEIKQDVAYVGVHAEVAQKLIERTNNSRLKTKLKVRISLDLVVFHPLFYQKKLTINWTLVNCKRFF